MVTSLEIFLIRPGGELLWRGSATSVDDAIKSVTELAKTSPGDYMIINLSNKKRFVLKSDGTGLSSRAAAG